MDVQNFDSLGFNRLDHNVGNWCQWQFSGTTAVSGSAPVRDGFQRKNPLVNRPHGWRSKVRVMAGKTILDVL
jgi:hypothetical protein